MTFKYHTDKRTIITTAIYIVVLSIVGLLLYLMYVGGYFSAWFISVMIALIALMALSIPRKIVVDDKQMTIYCLLEMVEIPIEDIISVERVEPSESRWLIPLFGSRGFFGYYGYYLDLATLERVRVYCTEWQNLIEIVDIYDDRYIVSSRQADELIALLEERIEPHEIGEEE